MVLLLNWFFGNLSVFVKPTLLFDLVLSLDGLKLKKIFKKIVEFNY